MQTFCIVSGFGAKKKSGGDLKPEDLWKLTSDIISRAGMEFQPGSPEHREWYNKIRSRFNLK